ncbi:MFS transporter [Saccharopolyspora karakumensis]|uniref:Putative proline/betaine transporter n=1 Tax=Saccharopolyspora karakumensis TaxID=2530386 RepID=A0A4R5BAL3_9PSEU|nr:MFS transporter [Saccharopolyspora karakumensis]TDD82233.1 MFS transporter [Saccharopolyspora karakumensis]
MTTESAPSRSSTTRVVVASLVGTTVEWYDFFLYGSAAALVFNQLFFPAGDPLMGTLLAFITYAVGFVARPLGGLVFGHYGDRIGRKKLLVLSLVMMGGATFAIGLLPTYQSVGVLAPLLLTALRLIQGFAIGGEWGGAVLIVSEHGSSERRGFWASWPQAGVPLGNVFGTAVLAVLAAVQSDEAFLAWGWRVAFLLSGVLVLIGLWVRLAVAESPVFLEAQRKAEESGAEQKPPILEVLSRYRSEVLTAMGARFAENVVYYVLTSFVLTYVATFLDLPRGVALNAALIASVLHFISIPIWGALSDRFGRRPIYLLGTVGTGVWAFFFFTMLDTKSFWVITFATTVGLVFHGAMYGPQAAFFAELFGTRVRYSGASIGYQLASIVAGSLAPIIATALLAAFDSSLPISIYVGLCSVVTLIAVFRAPETRERDLAADHAV